MLSDITRDTFFKGKVTIFQGKNGYRFSIDAALLAHFLPRCPRSKALEIGTGCGVIAMLALFKRKFSHIYGLEIQPRLSILSEINARENHFSGSFEAITDDFNLIYRDFTGINRIFSNPPFLKVTQGRLSPSQEIRMAKTEVSLDLKNVLEKTFQILGKRGSLYLIYPYSRHQELTRWSEKIGFGIGKTQMVFSFNDGKPERFLIQLSKKRTRTEELKPLVIFKEKGVYTRNMREILSG